MPGLVPPTGRQRSSSSVEVWSCLATVNMIVVVMLAAVPWVGMVVPFLPVMLENAGLGHHATASPE